MPSQNDKPPRVKQRPSAAKHRKIQPASSETETPKRRRVPWRLLFAGLLFCATALAIGGLIVRQHVINTVRGEQTASAAAVLGRPFPVSIGTQLQQARLKDRLQRLGYREVSDGNLTAGDFQWRANQVSLYLRGFVVEGLTEQPAQLIELRLNSSGEVAQIREPKYGEELRQISLEPETLALLSDSAKRASTPKRLRDFPPALVHALVAIEDERFYSHLGVDPLGLARAVFANVRAGHVVQGGSTLTQQLAKNLFFGPERTFGRKFQEAGLAILIETAFSKDQILELYLNEVFLGQEGNVAVHGFGEAARSFFGKDVSELSLAQSALLAGLVKAPTKLSPRRYPDASKERRELVLDRMLELGFINSQEHDRAVAEPLVVQAAGRTKRVAPYFVDSVRRQLEDQLNLGSLSSAKLRVVTGLDSEYQTCAENAVENGLNELERTYKRLTKGSLPVQAALVSVDIATSEIRAWVGGREYGENQFDRVSLAKRQPGSTFKPFVYLTALDGSLNTYRVARTTSVLTDEPMHLPVSGGKTWEPKNYDDQFRGDVTVRQALTHSLNIPTVQLAMKVGIDSVARTAELFGFGEDLPRVPSLALGSGEVTPLTLARAYEALADGGILRDVKTVIAVLPELESKPIFTPVVHEQRAASEAAVYVLTDVLRSVIEEGTAQTVRKRGFRAPAAGKTGTTNDTHDAWFAGYTPRTLAVVWVGFDDNRELKLTGGQAAAPIWTDYMKCVSGYEPKLDFVPPPGVVEREIDRTTGLLATPGCPPSAKIREVFVAGTEPITPCSHAQDDFGGGYPVAEEELPPPEPESAAPLRARRDEPWPEAPPGSSRASLPPARGWNSWERIWR